MGEMVAVMPPGVMLILVEKLTFVLNSPIRAEIRGSYSFLQTMRFYCLQDLVDSSNRPENSSDNVSDQCFVALATKEL